MKNIQTKVIENEFEFSRNLIKYKVENHVHIKTANAGNPMVNYNFNNNHMTLNRAEFVAMKEEQMRLEEELMKKQLIEERDRKLRENLKIYKINQKEKEENLKKEETMKKNKKDKIKDYNNLLRDKAIKKKKKSDQFLKDEEDIENGRNESGRFGMENIINNTTNVRNTNTINTQNENQFETFSFNEKEMETEIEKKIYVEKEKKIYIENDSDNEIQNVSIPMPMSKNSIYQNLNNHLNNTGNNVINLREDIDKLIKEKLQLAVANNTTSSLANNNNLDNVNVNINVNNINIDTSNLNEELIKNVENVKEFRKSGLFSTYKSTLSNNYNNNLNILSTNNNSSQYGGNFTGPVGNKKSKSKKNVMSEEQIKRKDELEKRRYMKALKNLMIEKFKEKSIIIPNICSCGQLQKKIDTLLEDKNVSVYSVMNIECANNCIYYKNTQEYHKALSDIIHSVKNLKFDSFTNQTGKKL